jgi:hypothetical protein
MTQPAGSRQSYLPGQTRTSFLGEVIQVASDSRQNY